MLQDLDEWDDDLRRRYPEPSSQLPDSSTDFRNYDSGVRDGVREFYRMNHARQTLAFVRQKRDQYLSLSMRTMGIWEAMEFLNTLVDDSDPDIDLPQIEHLLQTAEAIREDGHPRWFVLTGLIHDLGKILCLFGEPQWAVVGDTFPVGCRFSNRIVYPEFFADNPDAANPEYQTECGIYTPHCGLDNVLLSWGHDEYLYHVVKEFLPPPALAMIRYHSFYPGHRERAYDHLLDAEDHNAMDWVRTFNRYDLYTKHDTRPDVSALKPWYQELIAEYFPAQLRW